MILIIAQTFKTMAILKLLLSISKWGGDFSYNDASNDFVLNENDSLVVLGSVFCYYKQFY